jgi:hypothetical protein
LGHAQVVQLVIGRSVVGVCNAQVESQIAADLPIVANIEKGVVFLETQLDIAFFDDVKKRIVGDVGTQVGK